MLRPAPPSMVSTPPAGYAVLLGPDRSVTLPRGPDSPPVSDAAADPREDGHRLSGEAVRSTARWPAPRWGDGVSRHAGSSPPFGLWPSNAVRPLEVRGFREVAALRCHLHFFPPSRENLPASNLSGGDFGNRVRSGDAVQRVRLARSNSRLATTKARRRIPTKTTGVGPDPGTSVAANVAVFGRACPEVAVRTLREAVVEAAACVVSPAKAILIGYVPSAVGPSSPPRRGRICSSSWSGSPR